MLNLEDNVKELNKKLTDALSAEDDLNKVFSNLLTNIIMTNVYKKRYFILTYNGHILNFAQEKKDLLHRIKDLEVLLNRITQDPKSSKIQHIFTNLEFPKETEQIKGDSKVLREVLVTFLLYFIYLSSSLNYSCVCLLEEMNKKLRKEIEVVMQQLAVSQRQLQELKEKRNRNLAQITDLEKACSKVVREKEELLSKRNQGGHDDVNETKEGNCQHR